jgi:hydrogenase/urease accessory protein HupE
MLLGWDHLLFIFGVVLLAGRFDRAIKLISVFVLGHSLTLMLASLADVRVSPVLVDIVIALSVVAVGIVGLRGRPRDWTPIYLMVFGFGLVHGLGLATRLLDLGLPDDGITAKVLAFNIGLEIGQLIAVGLVVGAIYLASRVVNVRPEDVRPTLFAGMAGLGIIAAMLLTFSGGEEDTTVAEPPAVAKAATTCAVEKIEPPTSFAGGHPAKPWFGPGEESPAVDFEHVMGDGYVVVRYSPQITPAQADELRAMVETSDAKMVGGEDPEQADPLVAVAAYRKLTCSEFRADALEEFNATWRADVEAGTFR